MQKKILLGLATVAVVIAGVALTSAFEAHIINVTAHIENGLTVSTEEIKFGTVFPQEYLEREFTISLSDSFKLADRVDDVEYKIVQKPKCWDGNTVNPLYAPVDYATHKCPDGYTVMESLCPFLSKIPVDTDDVYGDVPEASYYDKTTNTCRPRATVEEIARGRLAKSENDTSDKWVVDLKVPPVDGYVGQDWPASCAEWTVPSNDVDYGCDLWIEVTRISESGGPQICEEKPDVMQVLDESGSILGSELTTLQTAAKAFIDALAPADSGSHMGQSSFETNGHLDHQLSWNVTTLKAAVDELGYSGLTNLYEGIKLANEELTSERDRDDNESPDFMVIITDGEPNRPDNTTTARAMAKAEADISDSRNTKIFVVGVGISNENANWLKDNIATSPDYYYDAGTWAQLEALLNSLVCH